MTRVQVFALSACILSGLALTGTLIAKKYWKANRSIPGYLVQDPVESGKPFELNYNQLRPIESYSFKDRNGVEFTTGSLDGEVWLASFFFSTCPHECRNQNNKIQEMQEQLKGKKVTFLSISVDPEHDSPVVLREYAKLFVADQYPWHFLTGSLDELKRIGNAFAISLDVKTHTKDFLLVDRFGRFRDRFSWQDPREMTRMVTVLDRVLAEHEAPFGKEVITRAVPRTEKTPEIAYAHGDWKESRWIKDFTLTERSGKLVRSQDLLGKTWVASFFFSKCPSVCLQQNLEIGRIAEKLDDLNLTYVSITSDTEHDTPPVLRDYARQFKAEDQDWYFLTGEQLHVERIGAEMFRVMVEKEMHSSKLLLVDRWGNVRGSYNWQDEASMTAFRLKVDKVLHEKTEPTQKKIEAEMDQASEPHE